MIDPQQAYQDLEKRLQGLDPASKEKLLVLLRDHKVRWEKINVALKELTDSLDNLRVYVKYMQFDLEATQRENAILRDHASELQEQLENHGYYNSIPDGLELEDSEGLWNIPPLMLPEDDDDDDLQGTGSD